MVFSVVLLDETRRSSEMQTLMPSGLAASDAVCLALTVIVVALMLWLFAQSNKAIKGDKKGIHSPTEQNDGGETPLPRRPPRTFDRATLLPFDPNERVKFYRNALREYSYDEEPFEFARVQAGLGRALLRLGERESGILCLEAAIATFRSIEMKSVCDEDPAASEATRMIRNVINGHQRNQEEIVQTERDLHAATD
jgi:hypothetical protein